MNSYWFINSEGEKIGPFSFEAIKKQPIKKETMVWHDGLPDWVRSDSLREFAGAFYSKNSAPTKITSRKIALSIILGLVCAACGLLFLRFATPLIASVFDTEIWLTITIIIASLIFVIGVVLSYCFNPKTYKAGSLLNLRLGIIVAFAIFAGGYMLLMKSMFGYYGSFDNGFARNHNSWYQEYPTGNYIVDPQGNIKYEYSYEVNGINRLGLKTSQTHIYIKYD